MTETLTRQRHINNIFIYLNVKAVSQASQHEFPVLVMAVFVKLISQLQLNSLDRWLLYDIDFAGKLINNIG